MKAADLELYRCPDCNGDMELGEDAAEGEVESGELTCRSCSACFPIVGHVPRFVPKRNYADSFALEWSTFPRTQYDSHSGATISFGRFFESTGFPERMDGEVVLEAGCGSGRFTEIAKATGARLFTFDYSTAVDVSLRNNGLNGNIAYAQADILHPPFAPGSFDRVLCLGVLQHTPDPATAFSNLANLVKPGGFISIDVYHKNWKNAVSTRRLLRLFTPRIPPERLLSLIKKWWPRLIGPKRALQRIPFVGERVDGMLVPIVDYRHEHSLTDEQNTEWSILDTFDIYSARYECRQSLSDVQGWFDKNGVERIYIGPGFNGIVARGRKPD
jgi:SAM-dependent methyltransferase